MGYPRRHAAQWAVGHRDGLVPELIIVPQVVPFGCGHRPAALLGAARGGEDEPGGDVEGRLVVDTPLTHNLNQPRADGHQLRERGLLILELEVVLVAVGLRSVCLRFYGGRGFHAVQAALTNGSASALGSASSRLLYKKNATTKR